VLHGRCEQVAAVPAPVFVSESPVPGVVLDGVIAPRLFVSRSVLDALSLEELNGALAHEMAHHRALDNLKRRMIAFAPDLVSGTRFAQRLEAEWIRRAELEADAAACEGSATQAVALASALIKVARLVAGHPPIDLGRAAFHDGAPVAERIRRLCETPRASAWRASHVVPLLAAAGLLTAVLVNAVSVLPAVHGLTEWLVHLP
jgi:Zn-dependent protease with chaperone function